jgi:hypothetical protein
VQKALVAQMVNALARVTAVLRVIVNAQTVNAATSVIARVINKRGRRDLPPLKLS